MQAKLKSTVAALLVAGIGSIAFAGQASAQAVISGGASLPALLYQAEKTHFNQSAFRAYVSKSSGVGKTAFLTNNPAGFDYSTSVDKIVHWAGSDSALTAGELSTYNSGLGATNGRLVFIPSAGTSVNLPYRISGKTDLDLTTEQVCEIFTGAVTSWSQIPGSGSTGNIQVVYRNTSSGTTEIFTTFLNNACDEYGITVPVTSTFQNIFPGNTAPSNFTGVAGSGDVRNGVAGAFNTIGYLSPDYTQAATVASIDGLSPDAANVTAALEGLALPDGDATNPLSWIPAVTPIDGTYPIVGLTYILASQCYVNNGADVKAGLQQHYAVTPNGQADGLVQSHFFADLPDHWLEAIQLSFFDGDENGLQFNNPDYCGVGAIAGRGNNPNL
ncbi:Phosphate-binding DING protein (related to PstS) |uniref:Phosphate-binding DING protein (Related to PstS) \